MSEVVKEPDSTIEAPSAVNWRMIGRVVIKAALLFFAVNLLFAAYHPLEALGRVSLYNAVFPGRARLPYGEIPAEDLNLTLYNVPAMLSSHAWSRPAAADEFRVLLIGDSGTWGWFLNHEDTLAGQLNRMNLRAADGRHVVVYNLGYPVMSLTKDLMLLDAALERSTADLVLWPVTLQSFAAGRQLEHPLLQQNAARVRELISRYDLALDAADPRFVERDFLDETLISRRRDAADLLRLQTLGLAWAATRRDQAIPDEIPLRQSDLAADKSWLDLDGSRPLRDDDLALDTLRAGLARVEDVPLLVINEPMYIGAGENSDVRYNSFYPRWAYDEYREMLAGAAASEGWAYLDLWDAIVPSEFSDTPVHLTPEGSRQFAALLAEALIGYMRVGE